jgi:predicted chitinase
MIDSILFADRWEAAHKLTELGRANLRRLVQWLEDAPTMADDRWKAYALATVCRECGSEFDMTIKERGKPEYFKKYDGRYGNVNPGDGYRYRGRGPVQLTFLDNYAKFGKLLGLDLVNDPDLACVPENGVKIMVQGMVAGMFTGVSLHKYIDNLKTDYLNARRIINGLDHAQEIADNAQAFIDIYKEVRA